MKNLKNYQKSQFFKMLLFVSSKFRFGGNVTRNCRSYNVIVAMKQIDLIPLHKEQISKFILIWENLDLVRTCPNIALTKHLGPFNK